MHALVLEPVPPPQPPLVVLKVAPPRFVLLSFIFGWTWRLAAATFFAMFWLPSIVLAGWYYRWMQNRVLKGWWKQSRRRGHESFEDFLLSCGDQAPPLRPRFFWRENALVALRKPLPNGLTPGPVRQFLRYLLTPIHSLWLNAKLGLQGLFCTYLVTGWGCLMMWTSWEFGWLNSFNKGYEQFYIGPTLGLVGILFFILAMFYVPMAQAHLAATGEARSFFHFRFIWQLVRTRLGLNCALACLFGAIALALTGARIPVGVKSFFANEPGLTPPERIRALTLYFTFCSFGLVLMLLLLHGVTAAIYRSAVLKALRQGALKTEDLHPLHQKWLLALGLLPEQSEGYTGLLKVVVATGRWSVQRILFTLTFLAWIGYIVVLYVGYFFVANDGIAFLNHPTVQLPCVNYTPGHLK